LLQARNGLTEGCATRFSVGQLEFGFLLPAEQSLRPDSNRASGLFESPLHEHGSNSLFHFSGKFRAYALHPLPPVTVLRANTRFAGRIRQLPISAKIGLLVSATGVMNVIAGVNAAKGKRQ
jgi:hypothetical protein